MLTDDELLTVREQAATLAAAIGIALDVRDAATLAEAVRARFPDGAPPALADAITEGFALMRTGAHAFRTDTVAQLLGRPPPLRRLVCAERGRVP